MRDHILGIITSTIGRGRRWKYCLKFIEVGYGGKIRSGGMRWMGRRLRKKMTQGLRSKRR